MSDVHAPLRNLVKHHEFLIAIDSDGCAFDSMEIKHKECFIPNIVKFWELQPVSKFARAAAEFVNLYSKWRGVNRFPALTMTFDLLEDWPEVARRKARIPKAQPLRDWIARETRLGNPALKAEVERTGDPVLTHALAWSQAVNATIEDIVKGVPPFPFVRESLEAITSWADVIVCSATPGEALVREWQEHDIAQYAQVIAGQEVGSKKEIIALAAEGRWTPDRILMVGDAPGDMKAARGNQALFYPINPGFEDASWERFFRESANKFRDGGYTREYEAGLIAEFDRLLPELPPWKRA
jgi:phosphoglycolate phosphatase-like HAD superfamily hydrolase